MFLDLGSLLFMQKKFLFQQVQNEDQNSSKLEGTVLDFGSDTEEEEDLDITFIEE